MPDNLNGPVLLVGAGMMALEYAKVLRALNVPVEVVGRGEGSASLFREKTGLAVTTGGMENYLPVKGRTPEYAIVAVGMEELAPATRKVLALGIPRVLVEKPAGLNADEIRGLGEAVALTGAEVYVAYNRRFYASTIKAREMIEEDGGVSSFFFEFTEWSHVVEGLKKSEVVKQNWFLGNSTHVIDLAFHLGGIPATITCFKSGELPWHPSGAKYAGAGVTGHGALFSYHANWLSPGRWGVEIMTARRRLILRPLEELAVQEHGSLTWNSIPLDVGLDKEFKPGLYRQVLAFLTSKPTVLPGLGGHRERIEIIECIRNGVSFP